MEEEKTPAKCQRIFEETTKQLDVKKRPIDVKKRPIAPQLDVKKRPIDVKKRPIEEQKNRL